jgi:glycosyltransferase involved in cell wall biosynthesis
MKRVLIIASYLNDENMGAIRLRRIVKYLPRFGFEPTVITALPADVVLKGIPGVRIERVPAIDMKALYKNIKRGQRVPADGSSESVAGYKSNNVGLTTWLNRWFMIPDKQAPWFWPAVKRGRELMATEAYDLIFATLEPRTNLLVAAKLAQVARLPCVMEYRDLWNSSPYHHLQQPTIIHKWIHHWLEHRVLSAADRLSAVCFGIQRYLKEVSGPLVKGDIAINYNFYDPDEYPVKRLISVGKNPFTVIYAGSMYFSRKPDVFFRGMRLFLNRSRLSHKEFRFRWMGAIAALPDIEQMLAELELHPFVEFLGSVQPADTLAALQQADAALILQAPEDDIHIPGKLFEAFGARVPVLALANPCEVTSLIDRVHGGLHVPHQPQEVCDALAQLYEQYKQGRVWLYDEQAVAEFSAAVAVGKLAAWFEEACV